MNRGPHSEAADDGVADHGGEAADPQEADGDLDQANAEAHGGGDLEGGGGALLGHV